MNLFYKYFVSFLISTSFIWEMCVWVWKK